jgi:hypothetical protein
METNRVLSEIIANGETQEKRIERSSLELMGSGGYL